MFTPALTELRNVPMQLDSRSRDRTHVNPLPYLPHHPKTAKGRDQGMDGYRLQSSFLESRVSIVNTRQSSWADWVSPCEVSAVVVKWDMDGNANYSNKINWPWYVINIKPLDSSLHNTRAWFMIIINIISTLQSIHPPTHPPSIHPQGGSRRRRPPCRLNTWHSTRQKGSCVVWGWLGAPPPIYL